MDVAGNKAAKAEIAMIKVVAPNMACQVIDWAMQVHGGGGVSQDFPLAYFYADAAHAALRRRSGRSAPQRDRQDRARPPRGLSGGTLAARSPPRFLAPAHQGRVEAPRRRAESRHVAGHALRFVDRGLEQREPVRQRARRSGRAAQAQLRRPRCTDQHERLRARPASRAASSSACDERAVEATRSSARRARWRPRRSASRSSPSSLARAASENITSQRISSGVCVSMRVCSASVYSLEDLAARALPSARAVEHQHLQVAMQPATRPRRRSSAPAM